MRRALTILAAALALPSAAPAAAGAAPYAALGDSYTAAPFVLFPHGDPIDCARSTRNYPALVAGATGLAVRDASCPGATTGHAFVPQAPLLLGGTNPPQLSVLGGDEALVTVGLGANDSRIFAAAADCLGAGTTTGTDCRDRHGASGPGTVRDAVEQTAARVGAVLAAVRARAPRARVLAVGYPAVTPSDGRSCPAVIPLSADDHRFIDELVRRLNAIIAAQAAAHGAEFVDTYAPSVGHDVCAQDRWIEGVLLSDVSTPLHPNARGEAGIAAAVLAVLRAPPTVPGAARSAPSLDRMRVVRALRTSGPPARVSLRLERPATVTLTLRRRFTGRRDAEGRCRPPARSNRGGRRCRADARAARRTSADLPAGTSVVRLTRRFVGRRAGWHTLAVVASADGRRSEQVEERVRVRHPSRR